MATPDNSKTERRFTGWLFFPIALFPLVALLTYDHGAIGSLNAPVRSSTNWIGAIGDGFAYCAYLTFGLAAWIIPVLFIVIGARVVTADFLPAIEAAVEAGFTHLEVGGGARFQSPFFYCGENAFDSMDTIRKTVGPDVNLQTLARGVNVVGLPRRGFSRDVIHALKDAHRFIYREGLNRTQALERVENDIEQFDEIKTLVSFYRNSTRGVS